MKELDHVPTKHRVVKSDVDLTITEVTRSGGKAYSVGSKTDLTLAV
jgi:hypothetical protein